MDLKSLLKFLLLRLLYWQKVTMVIITAKVFANQNNVFVDYGHIGLGARSFVMVKQSSADS